MAIYYKNGFYNTDIAVPIPEGAVQITDKEYQDLMCGIEQGKSIVIDETGHPYLEDAIPAPPTIVMYDAAAEEYIKSVRVERGYTTREPSDYKDDPNPRWNQDAIDFIDFRSRVMQYSLEVQNKYEAGETIPTLDEFKEHLLTIKCNWTYATA